MSKIALGWMAVILVVGVSGCAAKTARVNAGGARALAGSHPVRAKIVLKRDPDNAAKCLARTFPKVIQMDFDEDDAITFVVRQKPGAKCLPAGVELELRWTGANPTACSQLGTGPSGDKTKFECNLDMYTPNTKYPFKLYRKGATLPGGEEMVEDPDIEIVQF